MKQQDKIPIKKPTVIKLHDKKVNNFKRREKESTSSSLIHTERQN